MTQPTKDFLLELYRFALASILAHLQLPEESDTATIWNCEDMAIAALQGHCRPVCDAVSAMSEEAQAKAMDLFHFAGQTELELTSREPGSPRQPQTKTTWLAWYTKHNLPS